METMEADSWEIFEKKLRDVRHTQIAGKRPELLFRGISDSTWQLTTTLERAGQEGMAVSNYYRLISRLKPQIETFTGRMWDIATLPHMEKQLQDYDSWANHLFPGQPEYSYMVYLRHHSFPSPLLDWTGSPFIAAFFAFRSPVKPRDGKVSVYAYSEMPKGFKVTGGGTPFIRVIGPYVTTHRRHFLQRSDYTVCARFINAGDEPSEWHFAGHEAVFQGQAHAYQDFLWKFNIPWAERTKTLKLLDEYNLNGFSLFDSEESLMETLGVRALDFN